MKWSKKHASSVHAALLVGSLDGHRSSGVMINGAPINCSRPQASAEVYANLADVGNDKRLVNRDHQLTRAAEPILALPSPGSLRFDRRAQLSASAIQKARLVGSCLASCLHKAARDSNSN